MTQDRRESLCDDGKSLPMAVRERAIAAFNWVMEFSFCHREHFADITQGAWPDNMLGGIHPQYGPDALTVRSIGHLLAMGRFSNHREIVDAWIKLGIIQTENRQIIRGVYTCTGKREQVYKVNAYFCDPLEATLEEVGVEYYAALRGLTPDEYRLIFEDQSNNSGA